MSLTTDYYVLRGEANQSSKINPCSVKTAETLQNHAKGAMRKKIEQAVFLISIFWFLMLKQFIAQAIAHPKNTILPNLVARKKKFMSQKIVQPHLKNGTSLFSRERLEYRWRLIQYCLHGVSGNDGMKFKCSGKNPMF